MWKKGLLVIALAFFLFVAQIVLSQLFPLIDLLAIVLIYLSLKNSTYQWYFVVIAGIFFDLAQGLLGLNLVSLLLLNILILILVQIISFQNSLALVFISGLGLLVNILFRYFYLNMLTVLVSSFSSLYFQLSFKQLFYYIVVNTLIVFILLMLKNRKKSFVRL